MKLPSIQSPAFAAVAAASALVVTAFVSGCESSPPEPTAAPERKPEAQTQAKEAPGQPEKSSRPRIQLPKPTKKKVSAKPVAEVKPSEDDPIKGKWTLADATKGLPAGKSLVATIETDQGSLECTLFEDKAPITVANFVGLARGLRPWKTPEGKWEKKPAYDGTIFHRIIKGFMIQGGDAKKNGTGEAGYVIPDEIWEDANHDRPGLLCMANRGPNTNSAQFFITDEAAFHLDGGYTIFGECAPVDVVHKIASVPVVREKPENPPVIKKVTVARK
ncbi:peptidylprolyl isomerase [Polyangium sp. y55x31]|uniref:peptidylprolyl isomerase n=1 Tax=Polyangium sp. y55x31 TaxID=3042688 RepID=UPI0024822DAF|nr:peptidylprolyl isomerase [Polyangium sp. y55x31]MDI1484240.1 peptidylprolyl isomerase [Polyangium sp. y55x31]